MKRIAPLALILALAACVGNPPAGSVAYYDLGPQPGGGNPSSFHLRGVEVVAPSWLETPALQYRLAFVSGTRRQSYADSRWIAPPGELIEAALRRAVLAGGDVTGGCRLHVDLDEFIHQFDSAAESRGVVELRAAVLAPRNDHPLARRSFTVARPAATPDARGAVEALAAAVAGMAAELRNWLAGLDREGRPGLNIAQTCNGA